MISNKGNLADWDPTSTTVVHIDNQITRRRHKVFVMQSRHETLCRLMAQFTFVHPVTNKLEWTNFDPLRRALIDICIQVNPASRKITLRIYANCSRKKALKLLAALELSASSPKSYLGNEVLP